MRDTKWFRAGEGYIDICIFVLIFAVFMMFSFSVFGTFMERVTMGQIADKVLEEAVKTGMIESDTLRKMTNVYVEKGYQIEIVGESESTGPQVQLGDKIVVTVTKYVQLMGWGKSGKELCLTVQKEGCSERYQKPEYAN